MEPERWQHIDQLFHEALKHEPAQRSGFLDHACAGDRVLRNEVEDLLSSHEQAHSFIETPASGLAAELLAKGHADLKVGQTVGHYEIVSVLGVGGMGEVYLAHDSRLGRQVALKLLGSHFTVEPERVRRFEQEARAVSALNHPNIVTIHEIGSNGDTQFIVTEFVQGQTLRQQMSEGAISPLIALDVAIQVATALEAAHAPSRSNPARGGAARPAARAGRQGQRAKTPVRARSDACGCRLGGAGRSSSCSSRPWGAPGAAPAPPTA